MKKLTTKFLSYILAVSTVFSLSALAFAAEDSSVDTNPQYIEDGFYNPDKMTSAERDSDNKLIDEQVAIVVAEYSGEVDSEWVRNEIIDALENPEFSINSDSSLKTRAGSIIPDINIKNKTVAAALNVALSMLAGGASVPLSTFIKQVGAREAKKLFSKTITTRLKAWGAN